MAELAVLVPTRARPHQVPKILESWHMTGAFGFADLIFVVDVDDPDARDYAAEFDKDLAVQRMWMREWMPLVPKLNLVAARAAEEYAAVAFMGDDHIPRTANWANALISEHLLHGPSILYGRDGIQDRKLPTWWSMSSEIIKALDGRMVPAPVQHLYCDNAVKVLGNELGVLRYRSDLLIEHMHPFAGKAESDAQYQRVNRPAQYQMDQQLFADWLEHGMAADVTKVRQALGRR